LIEREMNRIEVKVGGIEVKVTETDEEGKSQEDCTCSPPTQPSL
jgi:hypothetical protein